MLLIKHDKSFHNLYVLIVLLLLMKLAPGFISGVKGATFGCIERERQALLKFKEDLIDDFGLLSTWGSEEEKRDCCKWRGVGCSNRTGHVTHLDLHRENYNGYYYQLSGNISNSLLELQHLSYLNLNGSRFGGSSFPYFIGSLKKLRYLDLSSIHVDGTLSNQFWNLSRLQYLDLSYIQGVNFTSLDFLSNFFSLQHLDLRGNDLSETIDWLQVLNRLPRLHELLLSSCSLSIIGSPSLSLVNSSESLAIVDFSFNDLSSSIFHWLANFGNSLIDLDLSHNNLQGSIPDVFTNMTSLRTLDLSSNQLQGDLSSFGQMCSLNKLCISENNLIGELSQLFGCVENSLEILQLDRNQLYGSLPDITRFTSMRELNLSGNQLNGSLPERFSQRSELFSASFRCDIGSDILRVLDLSNNLLTGSIPDCLRGLVVLNLASNNFSGKIPSSIGSMLELQTLSLHNNSFVGELPLSLRSCSSLVFLDLSSNKLRGEIPGWIGESMPSLKVLSLQSNGFSGSIPPNLCHLSNILILDLSLNNISGIIPKCLNNLTSMVQKTESESNNAVPSRSYVLESRYPPNTNGRSYRSYNLSEIGPVIVYVEYMNEIRVGWKGRADVYRSTLGLLRILDFSGNKLQGEIPEEITGLLLLVALNLSGNNLTGEIPQKIGQLKQLESLDLSGNQLSGVIPITMADLTFLSYLNLSNNHLSGRIPSSTQLQGFNASQFTGNHALCGQPLLQKCPGDETNQSPPANDDNRGKEVVADEFMKWFCISMGIGFSVFFWGVSGALLLKRSWRHAYFRFLDESWDWLYVKVAVRKARIQREFQRLQEHVLA
eukprot:XP_024442697.1 receptor-like protein EIX2 [Populus trichocarpa]